MLRNLGRFLVGLLSVVLVLGILLAAAGIYTVRRSFPQTKGELQLPGLDGPVDVYRDRYGIPQIYATTQHDLFFAQGYVHAQDRFWQMDVWRHTGSARLSEMFGDSTLDTDKFLSTLGWARVAQQELDMMDASTLSILRDYADGVNAYLADHKGIALSVEYAVLKLLTPGYQIEPWEPLNTLTWAKSMAWDLKGNMDEEVQRALLLKTLTPEQVNDLFPSYPADHPLILPSFQASAGPSASSYLNLIADAGPALEDASREFSELDKLLDPSGSDIGSNNWVISGKLTSTGEPLLANDPHLGAQMPSIWYEAGLHCLPQGPDCNINVTGFSFAGAPGVIVGHNDHIAWGVTNLGPDVMDLYIEKINHDNPNQYDVNGQWVNMEIVNVTIQVAGGSPVELAVRYTRHGPIISDTYGSLKDFKDNAVIPGMQFPEPYAISLRWTALEPTALFRAILGFDTGQNWDDFRQAARDFVVPAQNLVYADTDGNIGYQTPGWIPIRNHGDGRLPVPGWTDEYEWNGYIPFEKLPFTFNPSQGYVATANNAVVGSDYPYLITTDWDYGYRAQRIVDMIENAPGPIDIAYFQKMQGDDLDLNAKNLVPILLEVPLNDAHLEQVRSILQGWDFQDQMDSAPAALFASFWKHLLADTFDDELPEKYWPAGSSRWFTVLGAIADQPNNPWWDNQSTPEVETRDQIIKHALGEAVLELEGKLGKTPENWKWGDLHTLTFRNQSLGDSGIAPIDALLNRGPFRTSGGSSIVNATGWDASSSYEVVSLPSMRMIVDLSNLANSLSIHTTGQSGHAYNPHYIDMADMWRTIQYHSMLWTQSQVEGSAADHLRLLP